MTRDLEAELFRLGCYGGPVDGHWTPALRSALQAFTTRMNAALPIDRVDVALVSLARSQKTTVCGPAGPAPAGEQSGEQAAFGPAPDSALVFEESFPATALDGRMSLGAPPPPPSGEQKSAASPRRSVTREEKLFTHPLGQL